MLPHVGLMQTLFVPLISVPYSIEYWIGKNHGKKQWFREFHVDFPWWESESFFQSPPQALSRVVESKLCECHRPRAPESTAGSVLPDWVDPADSCWHWVHPQNDVSLRLSLSLFGFVLFRSYKQKTDSLLPFQHLLWYHGFVLWV
jgi:hypothetical protein